MSRINVKNLNKAYKILKDVSGTKGKIVLYKDKLMAVKDNFVVCLDILIQNPLERTISIEHNFFKTLDNIKSEYIHIDWNNKLAKIENLVFKIDYENYMDIYKPIDEFISNETAIMSYSDTIKFCDLYTFVSKEKIRPIIQHINWNKNIICGLDGYRISKKSLSISINGEYNIHGNVAKILSKLCKKNYVSKFEFNDTHVTVKLINSNETIITIFSPLDKSKYINYDSLIRYDQEYDKYITLSPVLLLNNLKLVKDNFYKIVKLKFSKDNYIISNSNIGIKVKSENELYNIENLNNECFEIYLNYKYLEDALKTKKGLPYIKIKLNTKISPIYILTNDDKDVDLILPVRVSK